MVRHLGYVVLVTQIAIAFCRKHRVSASDARSNSTELQSSRTLAASFMAEEAMHIVYSACGDHAKGDVLLSLETLWLFASVSLMRGDHFYHIHVLTDGAMNADDLSFLQPLSHFKATIHPLYPESVFLFKRCSSERLYLHEHEDFKQLNKVLYVDGDTLWLDDPLELWRHLEDMDRENAIWGLVEEAAAGPNWYTDDATHPYYGARGLNAGVMLADLWRIRGSTFSTEREDIINTWGKKGALPWGDQDVLNTYLNAHHDQAYVLPCKFNVRTDSVCSDIAPIVYHGNRNLKNDNHQYSHLYTFFKSVDTSNFKLSGKPWSS